jgi:hypothetical protein
MGMSMRFSSVMKRTFKALEFPKGTPERVRLNADAFTSEYLTGEPWVVEEHYTDGRKVSHTFRTKTAARMWLDSHLQGPIVMA